MRPGAKVLALCLATCLFPKDMEEAPASVTTPAGPAAAWAAGVRALVGWLALWRSRSLGAETPEAPANVDHRRFDQTVRQVFQNLTLADSLLVELAPKRPRKLLEAAALAGLAEVIATRPERRARAVHAAVEWSKGLLSQGECGFLNALLRRSVELLPLRLGALPEPGNAGFAEALATRFSHPRWWCVRALERCGPDWTARVAESNQELPRLWIRLADARVPLEEILAAGITEALPGYGLVPQESDARLVHAWLSAGLVYAQAPAAAAAVDLLKAEPGEALLDLCSAPGGKALLMAHRVGPEGMVVAVDLPGERMRRLKRNLELRPNLRIRCLGGNVTKDLGMLLEREGLSSEFAGVLVDVPCTNTGVWRHKPDARWRITPESIEALRPVQEALLCAAAERVRPGGRLVYSTCSLDPDENGVRIAAWLASETGRSFRLVAENTVAPWEGGGDGAYAARLERVT